MIFNKQLKEKVILLEYENKELHKRLKWLEEKVGTKAPPTLHGRRMSESGWDVSYDTLRMKYRKFTPKYDE